MILGDSIEMNSRQRVLKALRHEEPDRVPLFYRDVPEVEKRLLKDLDLESRDELLEYLDIDFRWVGPDYIGPSLHQHGSNTRRDIWGAEYEYVRFSESAGYWQTVSHPLAGCDDPSALKDYPWPRLEWFDFSTLAEQVTRYNDFAIMTAPNFSSPGILQCPVQTLLGEEKSLMTMAINPDFFDALIERILQFQIPFIERMLATADDRIDFFRIGDDFGTQRGLLISPEMWRQRICPALKAMADVAKRHGACFYLHSCGGVRRLIPDFIEIGVDVLDPIQVRADGMEPESLKREFGDQICFSGGVDEQQLLPAGSPVDVRKAVIQLLSHMARGGGFFVGPTHNLQDDIPTDNILAMYDAAVQWSV